MRYSRLRKFEDQKQQKNIYRAIIGIVAIFLFLALFGIRILVGFSLFVDKIKGTSSQQISQTVILPPELNPLPTATNSASITVSGEGQSGLTVILYINNMDTKKMTVEKDGTFKFENIPLGEGENAFSAKLMDDKNNLSTLSAIITVTSKKTKPTLDVSSPSDNAQIRGDKATANIIGKTNDGNNTVTVNDRMVIVRNDGSFSYDYNLPNGDTVLKIIATDPAGNQTTIERKVNYSN